MSYSEWTHPKTKEHFIYLVRVDLSDQYDRARTYYSFNYGLTWARTFHAAYDERNAA